MKMHRETVLSSASVKLEWIKNLNLMNKATQGILNKEHAQVKWTLARLIDALLLILN